MSDERDKFPSEMADRFQVRMPPGMRDQIRDAAQRSGRSMNSEIIHRLEESFAMDQPTSANRSGFWQMPEGISGDDFAAAIEEANKQALAFALKRLGVERRSVPEDWSIGEEQSATTGGDE